MDVTNQGSNLSTSMDGFGQPLWPPWDQQTCSLEENSMLGHKLALREDLSLMVFWRMMDLVSKHVLLSLIISSMMVSPGMIPSAMTEDTLYARTSLLETSTLSDRRTQMYEFLENFYSLNYFITSWAFKVWKFWHFISSSPEINIYLILKTI